MRMPTLITPVQHSTGSPNQKNQEKKELKDIQTGKEVKLSLFSDNMILCLENSKDSIKRLLELINDLVKFQEQNQYTKISSTHQ